MDSLFLNIMIWEVDELTKKKLGREIAPRS